MKTNHVEVPEWLSLVAEKVASLQYGVVQIVVHNSRVTQIDRTEKTRVDEPSPTPSKPQQVPNI
jgi:hypothetical protein